MPEPIQNAPASLPEEREASNPLKKKMPLVIGLCALLVLFFVANMANIFGGGTKKPAPQSAMSTRPTSSSPAQVQGFTKNQDMQAQRDAEALAQQNQTLAAQYQALQAQQSVPTPEYPNAAPMTPAQRQAIYGNSPNAPAKTSTVSQAQAEGKQRVNYWVNPLPGVGFGFNHLFSYLAQMMAQVFDQNSLSSFTQLVSDAGDKTPLPSITAPLQILCYVVVQIVVGVASAILFFVNISAYIFYGVTALFGPIFIPLYMTKTFRGKFLNFIDVLIGFAMIRAVAAAFIFIWAGFMNAFITQTFNGDYSLDNWIAHLALSITMFIAFILNMLYIPTLTQAIFGGSASVAGRAEQAGGELLKMAAAL